MPELPDVTVYVERINAMLEGATLQRVVILNPFVLRSVAPTPDALAGRTLVRASRLGKRILLDFGEELFVVIHLMIAGRLRWRPPGQRPPVKLSLAEFAFPTGSLFLTEAGSTRRASIHLVQGHDGVRAHDRGGLEPLEASRDAFGARLRSENHTLKRALTDPRLFSGIGNAYSDEILHAARLSPLLLTSRLHDDQIARLHDATVRTLTAWTARLREEVGEGFPETVTAFHAGMAVHGRFGEPCPVCATPVQRIRYADNETNYCARCQTEGRLLADRALSRLLKSDWPRSLDALEG